MAKKKVLIIAYYWPPSGGGGVQRWVKFVKYLGDFDWEPIVYVPENPDYPQIDSWLASEIDSSIKVIKGKIWEPYDLYRWITGNKNANPHMGATDRNKDFLSRVLHWVRGNFFIPDAKVFWVKPSIKRLVRIIEREGIEYGITTGPPHSLHLIGYGLKKKTGLKWCVDFRDPWFHLDNLEDFKMSKWALYRQKVWEKRVVQSCDKLITITNHEKEANLKYKDESSIAVIPNGYDEDDFKDIPIRNHSKFIVGHYGTAGHDRNYPALYGAIVDLLQEVPDLRQNLVIEYIGPTDGEILDAIKNCGLEDYLNYVPYLQHNEVAVNMKNCSILLLLINNNRTAKSRMTGKIFEYLAMGRPILGVGGKDGEAEGVLVNTDSGEMFGGEDKDGIKEYLKKVYGSGQIKSEALSKTQEYSRKALTEKLSRTLNNL